MTALGWMAQVEVDKASLTCASMMHIMQKPSWRPEEEGREGGREGSKLVRLVKEPL